MSAHASAILIRMFFSVSILIGFSTNLAFGQQSVIAGEEKVEGQANEESKTESEIISLDVGEALEIDGLLEDINQKYTNFLKEFGMSDSFFGALVSSLLLIIVFFVAKMVMVYALKSLKKAVLNYKSTYNLSNSRINIYFNGINSILTLILICFTLIAGLSFWNINLTWLSSDSIQSFITSLLSLLFVFVISMVVLEVVSGLLDRYFVNSNVSNSRITTIKPIAKNSVLSVLAFVFSMVGLSQLGIDVVPLLAGAGVLGIAIGFGAQALVKDVITGFIIILEDLLQIGDIVTLNDKTGVIEKITVRKVQLRNLDGTVYTIPFGEISIVENHTKLFSYYLMKIGVAYRENIDEVIKLLNKIGQDLKEDETYSELILEDLEILGLDEFADSAVIIKARIKTKPKKQWLVGREFNRRMKIAFDKQNIEIPFPHQTLYFGEDKQGNAPALNVNQKSISNNQVSEDEQP